MNLPILLQVLQQRSTLRKVIRGKKENGLCTVRVSFQVCQMGYPLRQCGFVGSGKMTMRIQHHVAPCETPQC